MIDMKKNVNGCIMSSLRPLVVLGQFSGLIPINGVFSNNPYDLKFTWISLPMLNTIISIVCIIFFLLIGTAQMIAYGFSIERLIDHTFYVSGFATSVIFFYLAKHWKIIMIQWHQLDRAMEKNYGYPKNLDRNLRILICSIMILAAVEHFLSLGYHVLRTNIKFGHINESIYYVHIFPQIFQLLPYSTPLAAFAQYVSFISTVTWNYNDLFIIIISVILTERFKQISRRLNGTTDEQLKKLNFWVEIREDYNRICDLCKLLEEKCSLVVLASFATNYFFILIQILNSLKPITDSVGKVYFSFSFTFLIFRTVTLCLYGGFVNEASKETTGTILTLPEDIYNNEIYRLLLRLQSDNAGLSGHKMFKLTKGLILEVAGAIVIYELALMQFCTNYIRGN